MVAALYCRADSNYKAMAGVDVWDAERDAKRFSGPGPVIAHPPCGQWGRLRHFAKVCPELKALALLAIGQVRKHGGVLEHPAGSRLWPEAGLPEPGCIDEFGGWTLVVSQSWWGHRAEKMTRLYIVGCSPSDVPPLPLKLGRTSHVVSPSSRLRAGMTGYRPQLRKAEREHTPPLFADWLVQLARRCHR